MASAITASSLPQPQLLPKVFHTTEDIRNIARDPVLCQSLVGTHIQFFGIVRVARLVRNFGVDGSKEHCVYESQPVEGELYTITSMDSINSINSTSDQIRFRCAPIKPRNYNYRIFWSFNATLGGTGTSAERIDDTFEHCNIISRPNWHRSIHNLLPAPAQQVIESMLLGMQHIGVTPQMDTEVVESILEGIPLEDLFQ